MAAAIAHTIAVVDKSGKVVSTSKQLKNVFMEAKFAYQERKAEIVADRRAKADSKQDKSVRRAVTNLRIEDARSERSSTSGRRHSHHRHHESERHSRPDALRIQHSSSSSVRGLRERDGNVSPRSPLSPYARSPYAETITSHHSRSEPSSPTRMQPANRRSLPRRSTDMGVARLPDSQLQRSELTRSLSTTAIDMDLAYGDYHPTSIAPIVRGAEEKELLSLVDRARFLLDEANCAQHSVKAMIEHLQKNPDAMAAVALTLAEISNIAAKMAPGALTALKGSAPAVFALLASPQFLIAAGVGIGVTVVMLGGYKIIKKIKAKKAAGKEGSMDEALEIDGDEVGRINAWRRGIVPTDDGDDADSELRSVGTSVEGEFITPLAAASMRGMETREDLLAGLSERERKRVERKREKKEGKERKKGVKAEKRKSGDASVISSEEKRGSRSGSVVSKGSATRLLHPAEEGRSHSLVKVKKPSPLRRLLA